MSCPSKGARALVLAGLLVAGGAHAGRPCEEAVPDPLKAAAAFETAASLQKMLDASGQDLVILARRGQDLEKYGVTYSHAGFAVKQSDGWSVYHDLNVCGTAQAKLYRQGLAEFTGDDLFKQEIAVVAPLPWLQSRLKQVLASKDEQFRMHHADYSAVAYPFSTKYQNSNGWLLETYARAAAEVLLADREKAQGWLRAAGYQPDVLTVRALTRLGGRMFKANVAFDDHPDELRWSSKITVNTGDAVLRFVGKLAQPLPGCSTPELSSNVCVLR